MRSLSLPALLIARLLMGQPDFLASIGKPQERPSLALPDLRGAGGPSTVVDQINSVLWEELDGSGVLRMIPKVLYPLRIPQQPTDFGPKQVSAVKDWSAPPVDSDYLAFGYATEQSGRLVLLGWLYNVRQQTPASAQLIAQTYFGSLDRDGAKEVARRFAADIPRQFGVPSLLGSRIFFASDRTGPKNLPDTTRVPVKEIWSMDYDGTEQHQLTRYNSLSVTPAVSPSGDMFAFTTYPAEVSAGVPHDGNPQIAVFSSRTGRGLTFLNPSSSLVTAPEFAPDGRRLFFVAAFEEGGGQLCSSNLQGGEFRRISHNQAVEMSPKINPPNDREMVFISSRSGREQLWRSNIDGSDAEMLTDGRQYVANPSWSPDGRFVASAATGGYEPGSYSIFLMDMAKRQPIQLTHGDRSESPSWAPDGLHIVFSAKRGDSTQIYTMLADGTHVKAVTTVGNNTQPVWAHGLE